MNGFSSPGNRGSAYPLIFLTPKLSSSLAPPPLWKSCLCACAWTFSASGAWIRRILPRDRFWLPWGLAAREPGSQGASARAPQEHPKGTPRAPQEQTKSAQEQRKSAQQKPRAAQEHQRAAQERPRAPQERPREAKSGPRAPKSSQFGK